MSRRHPRRLPGHNYHLQGTYFVTFCTKNRERAFTIPAFAEIVVDALRQIDRERRIKLIAYCIMPDHVHVYFTKLDAAKHLSRIVADIKAYITKRIGRSFEWQRGYWDEIVRSFEDPRDVIAYILNNPVRAGIVADFRDYRFSGPHEHAMWAD
jgi:REP-associated tyrosine transposase